MRMRIVVIVAVLLGLMIPALAGTTTGTLETTRGLVAIRDKVSALQDMGKEGVLASMQVKQGTDLYLKKASDLTGHSVTLAEVMSIQDTVSEKTGMTVLQKVAGFFTFTRILWVFAIIIGIACGIFLIGDFVLTVLVGIPKEFWEVLLYLASVGLLVFGRQISPTIAPYLGLTGGILLAGTMAFSAFIHQLKHDMVRFWTILFVVWAAAAIWYSSSLIGFFAVVALLCAMGFSAAVHPFCIMIGFEDEDALGRGTTAALAVLIPYTIAHAMGINHHILGNFYTGAIVMGSFVGFLGLLISSTRWYSSRQQNYALSQVISLAAYIGAVFAGSVYGIGELQKMGGTFLAIFLLTKVSEIPVSGRRGYATLGLIISGLIYWFCVYANTHAEFFAKYLFMF